MEANKNKEFIFKKCQAYKKDFPEIQKDLNIFLYFKGILKYPIEYPIDQKIDNRSKSFIDDVFFRNYLQDMPVDYILSKTMSLFVFLKSDQKQNARSLLPPVSDPALHSLSHGSLGFALHGSFLNHFLIGQNSILQSTSLK